MQKFLSAAFVALFVSAPALAGANVVKFEPTGGEAVTLTFNDDGTVTSDKGATGTYTWNEETKTVCGKFAGTEGEVCATFAEVSDEVGAIATYTTNTGSSGTATLVAVTE